MTASSRPSLAVVISFRDEARHLPRLLRSLREQSEPAEEVLLIDDGSIDESGQLAAEGARQSKNTVALRRTAIRDMPDSRDRLVSAPELQAFLWGAQQTRSQWEVIVKMDGDLELPPTLFEEIRSAFALNPSLGITGSYLSIEADAGPQREYNPPHHVRGPNKFYRRACFEDISPLPAHLGWDTIDEIRARSAGWMTQPTVIESGDILHLRPTGSHNGRLRAYRRWGECAWGYGAHPMTVCAGAVRRSFDAPYLVAGASYAVGWIRAAITGAPRVDEQTRAFCQREELARMRRIAGRSLHTAGRPGHAPRRPSGGEAD